MNDAARLNTQQKQKQKQKQREKQKQKQKAEAEAKVNQTRKQMCQTRKQMCTTNTTCATQAAATTLRLLQFKFTRSAEEFKLRVTPGVRSVLCMGVVYVCLVCISCMYVLYVCIVCVSCALACRLRFDQFFF